MRFRQAVPAALVLLAGSTPVLAEPPSAHGVCGTLDLSPELARAVEDLAARLAPKQLKSGEVQIPIAFHNVYSGKVGKVTDGQVAALVHNLNVGFQGTPFSFYLYRVDRTNNKAWYASCGPGGKNEPKMKKKLARDPRRVLNIYSCTPTSAGIPPGQVLLGFAYYPFAFAETSTLHGVTLHPSVLPGGSSTDYGTYGLVGIHEVGHYLGLYHTFQGGCDGDGDFVSDTAAQSEAHFACPIGIDTCPDGQGPDDTQNFMNYSSDSCMNHFTPGQGTRMTLATQIFKPSIWP